MADLGPVIHDDWVSEVNFNTNGETYTDTSWPEATRCLIVCVFGEATSGTTPSLNWCKLGDQTLTKIGDAVDAVGGEDKNYCWMGYLLDAGIEAASSSTITLNWTTAPNKGTQPVAMSHACYRNVNQSNPIRDSGTNADHVTALSVTGLDVRKGDKVVYCSTYQTASSSHTAQANYTEQEEFSGPDFTNAVADRDLYTADSNHTATATWANGTYPPPGRQAMVAVVLGVGTMCWGRMADNVTPFAVDRWDCQGGAAPSVTGMRITGVRMLMNGSNTIRLGVYTGGGLGDATAPYTSGIGPKDAAVLFDAGEVTPTHATNYNWDGANAAGDGVIWPSAAVTWATWKKNSGGATNIRYATTLGAPYHGDFQDNTTQGRFSMYANTATTECAATRAFSNESPWVAPAGSPAESNAVYSFYVLWKYMVHDAVGSGAVSPSGTADGTLGVSWDAEGSGDVAPTAAGDAYFDIPLLDAWASYGTFKSVGNPSFAISAGRGRRLLLVAIYGESNGGTVADVNYVTWGGQTLTEIDNQNNPDTSTTNNSLWLGYLANAGIAAAGAGAKELAINWNTEPNQNLGPTDPIAAAYGVYDNVDQSTPIAAFDGTASNLNTELTVTINVPESARVVQAATRSTLDINYIPQDGYTEQLDFNGSGGQTHSNAIADRNANTADATHDSISEWATQGRICMIAAALQYTDFGGPGSWSGEGAGTVTPTATATPDNDVFGSGSVATTITCHAYSTVQPTPYVSIEVIGPTPTLTISGGTLLYDGDTTPSNQGVRFDEPSGMTWNAVTNRIWTNDDGNPNSILACIDRTGVQYLQDTNWTSASGPFGDMEEVVITDPSSDFVYAIREGDPLLPRVIQYSVSGAARTGRYWDIPDLTMPYASNEGVECCEFIPDPSLPFGGVWYFGQQYDGLLWIYSIDLENSVIDATGAATGNIGYKLVKSAVVIDSGFAYRDIGHDKCDGFHYDRERNVFYVSWWDRIAKYSIKDPANPTFTRLEWSDGADSAPKSPWTLEGVCVVPKVGASGRQILLGGDSTSPAGVHSFPFPQGGEISCIGDQGNGIGLCAIDEYYTVTVTPESGYHVRAWSGTDNDSSHANVNYFTTTYGQNTVTALLAIYYDADGAGSVSPTGAADGILHRTLTAGSANADVAAFGAALTPGDMTVEAGTASAEGAGYAPLVVPGDMTVAADTPSADAAAFAGVISGAGDITSSAAPGATAAAYDGGLIIGDRTVDAGTTAADCAAYAASVMMDNTVTAETASGVAAAFSGTLDIGGRTVNAATTAASATAYGAAFPDEVVEARARVAIVQWLYDAPVPDGAIGAGDRAQISGEYRSFWDPSGVTAEATGPADAAAYVALVSPGPRQVDAALPSGDGAAYGATIDATFTLSAGTSGAEAAAHNAVITSEVSLTAASVAGDAAAYNPSLFPGAVTETAATTSATATAYAAGITGGSITLTASTASATGAAYVPKVTGEGTLIAGSSSADGAAYVAGVTPGPRTVDSTIASADAAAYAAAISSEITVTAGTSAADGAAHDGSFTTFMSVVSGTSEATAGALDASVSIGDVTLTAGTANATGAAYAGLLPGLTAETTEATAAGYSPAIVPGAVTLTAGTANADGTANTAAISGTLTITTFYSGGIGAPGATASAKKAQLSGLGILFSTPAEAEGAGHNATVYPGAVTLTAGTSAAECLAYDAEISTLYVITAGSSSADTSVFGMEVSAGDMTVEADVAAASGAAYAGLFINFPFIPDIEHLTSRVSLSTSATASSTQSVAMTVER